MKQRERSKPRQDSGSQSGRLVVGVHPVSEVLDAAPETVKTLFVVDGQRRDALAAIVAKAQQAKITVVQEPMRALDDRAQGMRHQGVVALVAEFPYVELDGELAKLKQAERGLIVFLDSVQDPHNTGAIIRSAVAFGADLVVLPKDRASPVTALVERAAAGTTARIPIARVTNLKRAIEQCKEEGFWIVGAGTRGGVNLDVFEFSAKTGVVIGAEGDGIRAGIEAALDHTVTIPISSRAESLNASNAAAVILYEIARKRTK